MQNHGNTLKDDASYQSCLCSAMFHLEKECHIFLFHFVINHRKIFPPRAHLRFKNQLHCCPSILKHDKKNPYLAKQI